MILLKKVMELIQHGRMNLAITSFASFARFLPDAYRERINRYG